jgi:hypothetical protein
MKAIKIICFALVTFIAGVFFSDMVLNPLADGYIPPGLYVPLRLERGASFQLNISSPEIDIKKEIITAWIREDRILPFLTDTGIMGKTVFTRITTDCANSKVAIVEQRAFDENMQFITAKKDQMNCKHHQQL